MSTLIATTLDWVLLKTIQTPEKSIHLLQQCNCPNELIQCTLLTTQQNILIRIHDIIFKQK